MPFIVQILPICNPYRVGPNLKQIHMHGTPHGVDNLPKIGHLYPSPSLSLIFSKWGPLGVILGGRAPCVWDTYGVACPMYHVAWGVTPGRAWV